MDQTKGVRTSNFSTREENILINLVKKYKNEIECKRTDTDNNKMKAGAWEKIYMEYNSILGDPHRSTKVLKNKYDNIKKRAKQKFADNKKYITGTGGGPFKDIEISNTESDLHDILGTQLTGLTSKYDSDATAESIIIQIEGDGLDNDIIEDIEEISPKKKIKIDASSQESSCLQSYKNENDIFLDDSQAFNILGATGSRPLMTRIPNAENSRESPKSDWTTYTPSMLKKPLSTPLQNPENKDVTPKKKPKCQKLSTKLEEWAKDKTKYSEVQEKLFVEKHQLIINQMKEKHEIEIRIQKEESLLRMKFLEEEHNLKMKILEKQYAEK